MIVYIKDNKIAKVSTDEFDVDEGNKYDERIETSDFNISDSLDYIDGNIVKIEIEEVDNILSIPE